MIHLGPKHASAPRRGVLALSVIAVAVVVGSLVAGPASDASAVGTASGPDVAPIASTPSAARTDVVTTANLGAFKPGTIISDATFFNRATMSETQIQAFLVSKVPACRSGYICLKDWYDTSRTTTADAMCGAYSGGVRERASRIIWKVAQACGINPQVLLTTLQKEQGLVTHTWPSDWRYTIAMGQGCPDTAACDTRYYGFFNQVFGAAWQFKRYANPPGTSQYFTWYKPGNTWNVLYHPNSSCGSSPVLITNQATANLYYYTPYQPNAAALAAGYGVANNPCSSYGNRNFYNYFNDWFGPSQPPPSPPAPAPAISSIDKSSYVISLSSAGFLLAYPFASGRWGSPIQVGAVEPGTRRILSLGDVDGDGHRDVIGIGTDGRAALYAGDGAASFGAARPIAVDWSDAVLVTSAGDFDGDGVADVFTTNAAGRLLLWSGTGWGGFRAPIVVGNGWSAMNLISGGTDLDGDSVADLIARTPDGRLFLYPGIGARRFRAPLQIGNGWSSMTAIFSPGDYSGDGRADVLARTAAGDLLQYVGFGGGRIAGGDRVGRGWNSQADMTGTGPANTAVRMRPPGAGDVDGDRAPDVVAVTTGGQFRVYRGDGGGGWRGMIAGTQTWATESRLVTLGDFNGDGFSDIGRIEPNGTFTFLDGRGDGTFGTGAVIGNGWNTLSMVIGGLDFDGDGSVDVAGRDDQGNLKLYRGDGMGGWAAQGSPIGRGWGGMSAILYGGDFDGDQAPDVIARAVNGSLWLYPMTGRGGWKTPRQVGNGWSPFTAIVGVGNFDGAGGPDVLVRNPEGRLILYRGDGRGGWLGSVPIGSGWNGIALIG